MLIIGAITFALAAGGTACAMLAGYLLLLALASLVRAQVVAASERRSRITVIVPAQNEERLIAPCVRSLLDQDYPRDLYTVVVVADNCSDATADVARAVGAEVLVRSEPTRPGKGHALRWAMDRLLRGRDAPDAVVAVDADSVADRRLLSALETRFAAGAEAVQAEYLVTPGALSIRQELVALGFLLFHRVRLAGRARLGLAANLAGNGMLFSRGLLQRHPWDAFTGAEDLEFTVRLRLAGVQPRYAPEALVWGPLASPRGATAQRLRWEGGRFHVQRRYLWRLLTACLIGPCRPWDMALDLAVPPLGLLVTVTGTGAAISAIAAMAGLAGRWCLVPWLVALIAEPAFVLVGMLTGRAPGSAWRALALSPLFVVWKLVTYRRLLQGFDPAGWVRSDRTDPGAGPGEPFDLLGLPLHPVGMTAALDRIEAALEGGRLFQVATVNLDFLVSAQRSPDVRRILQATQLNVPDGAPVVWLSRLLGRRVPERVAGADLVPRLLGSLASRGTRVFLLGGEGGAAAAAAERIQERWPGIVIAGCDEPPRAAIEDMDNRGILERIAAARADLLLVAFGHPKQERWIDRHRDRLQTAVVIGVGCVFDLLAGRATRAPRWMQRVGLEWLYRLSREPTRLAGRYALNARWLVVLAVGALHERLNRRGGRAGCRSWRP